ncbi:MAG: type IX secretion system protein PorG [Flavobacteriales bacterium]
MKFLTTFFFFIATVLSLTAQTYEIGGFIGGSNYIGDVGNTSYISPNSPAFGAIFKWNRSERHSFRATIIKSNIKANDKDSKEKRRQERGLQFENTITEASLGIEYTFWEFNMYGGRRASTPYLYTGLTYFWYKALFLNKEEGLIRDYESGSSIAIPMVVGYKASIGPKMVLAVEIGARYTFTDDLDGSNPIKKLSNNDSLKFGNINNNDWYVFTGVTLTFAFGRKPCYCNF